MNPDDDNQLREQIASMEMNLRKRLTKEAILRYGNIKTANKEQALQVLVQLTRILSEEKGTLTDEEFKRILREMYPKRRNIKIRS